MAMACQYFGIECKVYMVRVSYQQKPYRRNLMEVWGAKCIPSPSPDTQIGQKMLAEDANHPGSLASPSAKLAKMPLLMKTPAMLWAAS